MSTFNSTDIQNTCKLCGNTFSNQHFLSRHEAATHGAPWRCPLCSRMFCASAAVFCHIMQHLGLLPWRCNECGRRFARMDHLATHKRGHGTDAGLDTGVGERAATFVQVCGGQVFERTGWECQLCRRKFFNRASFQKHRKRHETRFKCDLCDKEHSTLANLNLHYTLHSPEWRYKCDVCSKKFPNEFYLKNHYHVHIKEKTHKCDVCNRLFSRPLYLQRHKLRHFLQKPLQCRMCGKEYATDSGLRTHLNSKHRPLQDVEEQTRQETPTPAAHAKEKMYACELCHKSFSFPSQLKRHTLQHVGLVKKEMKCSTCGKTFEDIHVLKQHLKRRHKRQSGLVTPCDPVACRLCGKEYGKMSALRVHQRYKHGHVDLDPPRTEAVATAECSMLAAVQLLDAKNRS